uniref:Ferredoxin n=1 Tax=Marinosulfonomonas methylotropha TaxID=50058 RepID=Q93NZ5_9RHOB|nr:ferredoxin [Marinosulfonomonas methylotropha]
MSWKVLCNVDDVPINTLKLFPLEGTNILVANYGQGFRAVPPLCPHMEEPLDESGWVMDCALTCMKHLWSWNLETLEKLGETEKPLLTYDVKKEGDSLLVWFEGELVYDFDEDGDDMDDDDFFS